MTILRICQHLWLLKPLLKAWRVLKAHDTNLFLFFFKLKETNAYIIPVQQFQNTKYLVTLYKAFDSLWKNKENDDDGWLFLASLDKLAEEKNVLCDKISQLLASQIIVKDNNKLSNRL